MRSPGSPLTQRKFYAIEEIIEMTTRRLRPNRIADSRLTRRTAVKAGAGIAAGAALSRAGLPALAQDAANPIVIPEPVAQLPAEEVTLRWIDSGDVKAFFWRAFFEEYQKAHPNITIEYQGLPWNEIQKVIPLGVRNGNAPDVFQIPPNVPAAMAVAEGWGAAFDDIIPNFEEFKAKYPSGVFVPGITDFDGKTYILPLTSNRRHGSLLLYNQAYMTEAGFDPATTPFTWEQFREAARVLTEQGAGEYYGLIFEGAQTGRYAAWANALGSMSGPDVGFFVGDAPIDWKTGEFAFMTDEFIGAIELLLALRDDGSIFPGSSSLNAPEARARVPQGAAAMIIQGPWNVPQWRQESPEFEFGVAQTPMASTDISPTYHVGPGGSNPMWVYAQSQHKEIAADIFSYVGSVEGQKAWAQIVSVADPALFPEAQSAAAGDDPQAARVNEIFEEVIRLAPDPRVRNPEAAEVFQQIQPVQPDYGTTIQGMFAGQITDIRAAMQGLQDAWTAELERAIKAAQDAGAQVTRDDFVFANWDPSRDYTDADYAAL